MKIVEFAENHRYELWDKNDFVGRTWKINGKTIGHTKGKLKRLGYRNYAPTNPVPEELLVCGKCGGKLEFPCPVYGGMPLCKKCFEYYDTIYTF